MVPHIVEIENKPVAKNVRRFQKLFCLFPRPPLFRRLGLPFPLYVICARFSAPYKAV